MAVIKRKCSQCEEWNVGDIEYCQKCNSPIKPSKIIEEHEKVLAKKFEIKRTKFDDFLDKMKMNSNPLIRITYYLLYATWTVVMFFVSIVIFLVAWTPG